MMLAFTASAQFVLVNSPSSIANSYVFTNAFDSGWGADLTTGVWTGDAIFVDDGTAPNTDGCTDPTNAAAIVGKIALIDRGTCQFSDKALRAQTAGAIAVVIFNNAAGAGAVGMGLGDFGATVTIPVVMLSLEDGQTIRTTMMTETVNMTIGKVQFPNDIKLTTSQVRVPRNGVMPADQADALGLAFPPSVNVLNNGTEDATNVVLEATISHTPFGSSTAAQVYNESTNIALLENDSSAIMELPDYVVSEGEGVYEVKYNTAADAAESELVDNDQEVISQFVLSKNIYCKGRWDLVNNLPINTGALTVGGDNVNDREYVAPFEVPKGIGYKLDSVIFYASSTSSFGSMVGEIEVWVYEWNDANADEGVTNDEIAIVAYTPFDLLGITDTSLTQQWFKVPLINFEDLETVGYEIPDDNKRYWVGVRHANSQNVDQVFFGFDNQYDQTQVIDNGFLTSDLDLPYLGIDTWNNNVPDFEGGFRFTGFWGSLATALVVNQVESNSNELEAAQVNISTTPNPASKQVVVETQLATPTKNLSYQLRDAMGRLVQSERKQLNGSRDSITFDVSSLAAGQYFVVVQTDAGFKAERFTVQH